MAHKSQIISALFFGVAVAVAIGFGQVDTAKKSIQFDLIAIGKSVYEAYQRDGEWPASIDDLANTQYLNMPYRKALLEQGNFVVVWQKGLDPDPAANGDRVLAFDNSSTLSRFGRIWVCRGDLRVEAMDAERLCELVASVQQ